MSVNFDLNVYGFTSLGNRIKISNVAKSYDGYSYVGGKIYYIDSTSDEVVEFYDENGEVISNVAVGDTPYAYKVISAGTSGKDKYYVYHDAVFDSLKWAPTDYQSTEVGGTSREIGYGKSNTSTIMALNSGAYVVSGTVWYKVKELRDALTGGCNDWFLPSQKEAEELRKAIGFQVLTYSDAGVVVPAGAVTGGTIAGVADGEVHDKGYESGNTRTCYPSDTKFINKYFWSSSESSATHSWTWYSTNQYWTNLTKSTSPSAFVVRAF